jgi:hypothetical protein
MEQRIIIIGSISTKAKELITAAIENNSFPIKPVINKPVFDKLPMPIIPTPIRYEDVKTGPQNRRERRQSNRINKKH